MQPLYIPGKAAMGRNLPVKKTASGRKILSSIVESILESYAQTGGVNHSDGANLPSREHIVDILEQLRKLIFPGYYDHRAVDESILPYTTGERVVWLYKHLSEEILKCLCYECDSSENCRDFNHCQKQADQLSEALLNAIPELRSQLKLDVQAALEGDTAAVDADEVIMAYPSVTAITVHRIAHFLHQQKVPLLPRIMSEYIHRQTGIDIHPGATIGESFFIDHGTGVVIGETTVIGSHVKLYQGVTLGALSVERTLRGSRRHPTIEDDVTIYAGATILGGETVIGRGSTIGGNVWIIESVPPNTKIYNRPDEKKTEYHLNHD